MGKLLLLCCCFYVGAVASSAPIADEQIFLERLQQNQLARLSRLQWQHLEQQQDHMNVAERFLHQVYALRFMLADLKGAKEGAEREQLWTQCQKSLNRLRTQDRADLPMRVAYTLVQFELIDFAAQQQLPTDVIQIQELVQQLETLLQQVEQSDHRRIRHERQQMLQRIRYAAAWSAYYVTQSATKPDEEALQKARNYMEGFLDAPLSSQVFVRAVLATVQLDLMLGQRQEALFLLDDVERHAHTMPVAAALRIWHKHLEIVQAPYELVALETQLAAFLTEQSSHAAHQLRFALIERLVALTVEFKRAELVSLAERHIDAMFAADSPLAERCLPFILTLARVQVSDDAYKYMLIAERHFEQQSYERAAQAYQSVLASEIGRSNIYVRHLLTIKLALALHRSQSSLKALQLICDAFLKFKQQRYRDFSVRLLLEMIEHGNQELQQQARYVYGVIRSLPADAYGQTAMAAILRHVLFVSRQEQFEDATALNNLVVNSGVWPSDAKMVGQYLSLMQSQPSQEQQRTFIALLKKRSAQLQRETLRHLSLSILSWQGLEGKALAEQQTFALYLRQQELLQSNDIRRIDFMLASEFQRRQQLHLQRELITTVLAKGVQDEWECEAMLEVASYFDARYRGRKQRDDAYYAGSAYLAALQFIKAQGDQGQHLAVQLAYIELLKQSGSIAEARKRLQGLPKHQQRTWQIQAALIECLELEGQYAQAIAQWRDVLARLEKGSTLWLRCKWHIAYGYYKQGEGAHALTLIDYILLMYPDMGAEQRQDFQELRKQCK